MCSSFLWPSSPRNIIQAGLATVGEIGPSRFAGHWVAISKRILEESLGATHGWSFFRSHQSSGQWSMSVLIFTVTIWPFNEWFWMIVNDLWMNYFTVTIVTAVFVNDFSCYVLLMTAIQCGVKFYISADRLHPTWELITAIRFMS